MCPTGTPVPRSCPNALSWHRGGRTTNAYAPISSARSICTNARHPIWSRFTHRKVAKRTEHPSQGVGSYAYRLAGLTHLAQIGCAGRQQALISVNATTANRLHPKQPPHDLGLRLHSYDTPAGSGSGSFPNHPPFAHRPTFHKYTAIRRKMHVRTRRSRPHPQPLSRSRWEKGAEEVKGGFASLRARVGPGNVGPDPERPWRPASARGSGVVIPDVILARAPPGNKCPGSRGKAH
jgi:hypothetical protein